MCVCIHADEWAHVFACMWRLDVGSSFGPWFLRPGLFIGLEFTYSLG